MWAWLRGKGRVDYQTPPQEAPARSWRQELADLDIRLSELSGIPPWERTGDQWDELDALLDQRMPLARPTVPVSPGPAEVTS